VKVWLAALFAVLVNAGVQASTPQAQSNAFRDARRLAELLNEGDGDGAVGIIHPNALAAMGGSQAVAAVLVAGSQLAKGKGVAIEVTVPSPPERIERVGRRLFALVKTRTWMTSPAGNANLDGFWLGVSEDAGAHWTFVVLQDAANAQDDARKLFPEGTGALAFPAAPIEAP
jgi:hypothetical protein